MKFFAYVALAAVSVALAGCACRRPCAVAAPCYAPPMVRTMEK